MKDKEPKVRFMEALIATISTNVSVSNTILSQEISKEQEYVLQAIINWEADYSEGDGDDCNLDHIHDFFQDVLEGTQTKWGFEDGKMVLLDNKPQYHKKDAYTQGQEAYHGKPDHPRWNDTLSIANNPYNSGTEEYHLWKAGYYAEMRKAKPKKIKP